MMLDHLRSILKFVFQEHSHIYDYIDPSYRPRYKEILAAKASYPDMTYTLFELSYYLRNYHGKGCIVLIDEYDQPLDVAFNNNYYDNARKIFATLFGVLLKVCLHVNYRYLTVEKGRSLTSVCDYNTEQ